MVEIDPLQTLDIYAYVGLKRLIGGLFAQPVDVVEAAALKRGLSESGRRDRTVPSDRLRQTLAEVRDNIALARQFVGTMSYEAFAADRRTVYAVTRALEIVSEAVRRLPEGLCSRHPHIPWPDIRGAGNVYRHDDEEPEIWLWY